ncbi:MAG: glycosyltransferase family 39 protein [PVC group bacterium]
MELSDKQVMIILVTVLILIYVPFILSNHFQGCSFLKGDMVCHEYFIESILQDHDWYIANNTRGHDPLGGNWPLAALDRNNRLVPIHSFLFPLLSIPFYLLFQSPGLLIFNVTCVIGLMLALYNLNRLFYSRPLSFITTLLFATSTLFYDYTYNYSPDVFSTLLVLGSLITLFKKREVASSFLLGFSIWSKLSNLIFVPFFLGYLIFTCWKERKKSILIFAICFFLPILCYSWMNIIMFGSPFTTGYDRMIIQDYKMVNYHGRFSQPLIKGIFSQLFNLKNGLIPTCPIMLFALPGFLYFKRINKKKEFILIFLLAAAQFLLFSKDTHWNWSHFSNRYLMTTVALSSVFVSNFIGWIADKQCSSTTDPPEIKMLT